MCGGNACVAVKNDGTAEAWGISSRGGDASSVDLTNVKSAMCGWYACVALKNDGTAEAWGDSSYGGDASTVDLTDLMIPPCLDQSNYHFTFYKRDGFFLDVNFCFGPKTSENRYICRKDHASVSD